MTHAAKKITSGEYEYRGWPISKIWTDWGFGEGKGRYEWFIGSRNDPTTGHHEQSYFDPLETLRDAKAAIDGYEDQQAAA